MKLVAGAIATLALVGSTPAFADLDAHVNGAYAWSHGKQGQVAVKDTAADSHSVYADYYRDGVSGQQELRNSGGNGTTLYSVNDTSHPVHELTACVAINFHPDPCFTDFG